MTAGGNSQIIPEISNVSTPPQAKIRRKIQFEKLSRSTVKCLGGSSTGFVSKVDAEMLS
jgi:hypothetical protein